MPRTSWRDLVDDDAMAAPAAAEAGAAQPEANARATRSLEEVPELRGLLEERRQLEEQLRRLTGAGSNAPGDAREARRFPILTAENSSRLQLRKEAKADETARDAGRRTLEVDAIDGRRAEQRSQQRRDALADRAARRRQAGAERVAQATETWDRHRNELLSARELARGAALVGSGLRLPGGDVSARVLRLADAFANTTDLVRERNARASGDTSRARRERDTWSELRDGARALARVAEEALEDSEAGRRLRRLREELPEPVLRRLSDHTGEGDVDVLSERRMRALDALRERRAAPSEPRTPSRRDPNDEGR